MAIPDTLKDGLKLPVIAAPMFLVSGPNLVKAACQAGVIGTFPSLNARPIEQLDEWMADIKATSEAGDAAPWGVNLIVHPTHTRLQEDLDLVLEHKPPLVITSVGHPGDIAEKIHSYGGVVFHDVIHMYHAQKAAEADVDGIIAVCAGAGGHAGQMNPFTFIPQLRREYPDKAIILAGTMSDGGSVRAAEVLGADFAYMGTRFIATKEANADEGYREMIISDTSRDIVYTDRISGIKGNFLSNSLLQAGIDPKTGERLKETPDFGENKRGGGVKAAWKEIWSAGQGVGLIEDAPSVAELVSRMEDEYKAAASR